MNKTSWIIILVLAGIAVAGWWLYLDLRNRPLETITVVDRHTDTIRIEKPVAVFTRLVDYKFFDFPVESVVVRDSLVEVPVPIETKTYQDSTYKLQISGFEPNLDFIEVYQHNTTVTQTKVQYRTPILSLGVGASGIWNPVTHNFDWGIGVSVVVPV